MKKREFRNDAWHMATHNGYPGCVTIVEKAMVHGYQLGLMDSTKEIKSALDREAERKRRSNEQR